MVNNKYINTDNYDYLQNVDGTAITSGTTIQIASSGVIWNQTQSKNMRIRSDRLFNKSTMNLYKWIKHA